MPKLEFGKIKIRRDLKKSHLKLQIAEIFNQLKNPEAPINSRLKNSIQSLKHRIENLESQLAEVIQDSKS